MKNKLTGVLLIAGLALSTFASAQNAPAALPTPKVVHKWDKKRVREGIKSGELTKRETKDIREDNRNLKQDVRTAKSDGKVTLGEKKSIAKDEAKLSGNIYAKKHNKRTRN